MRSVLEAYERGQTMAALERAQSVAPLQSWRGLKACILASRIAANAGAPRLATRLAFRAWREDRRNPEALAQIGYEILGRRGPLALWRRLRAWQATPGDLPEHVGELTALQGRAAAMLRDFANAEALLTHAESIDPANAWIHLQRAHLLESQDLIEEALDVARAACRLHPHPYHRPSVQTCAHLLQLLDRDDDAIRLLADAGAVLQSGPVAAQLYAILSENGRWAEAEAALERYVALSPLLEPTLHTWVSAQRARAAYHLGRRADAARFALQLDDEFHRHFAAALEAPPQATERVQLDITFVRQHFKTCAPATLASIGRYWRMPAEHLQLAEAICYDGTPTWQQREWAQANGWHVREFRVTHATAVALLERGIPFALSTVNATSAHMMAVIGFDRTRGTLLLRDPSQPYALETQADQFLQRYRGFGPLGIVFVPASERLRLEGITLPAADRYDSYHRFWVALSKHDRPSAAEALAAIEAEGDDALAWEARLDLATYDANVAEQARCLDRLLELFPDDPARQLRRFACLRDAPRDERIRFLETACSKKQADPALFIALARVLQDDARQLRDARQRLQWVLRRAPMDSGAIQTLADLLWEQGELDDATECYRFAANLEGFREHLYQAWFIACRRTRRTQEALEHLQDRFKRFGTRSEQPALTLAWAWKEMDRPARAREVLDEAIRLRPNDGYLGLRAAALLARLGEVDGADTLLAATKGKVRDNDWLRTRLELAESRLASDEVLATARRLLETEPLALDAHAAVARALARREGTSASLTALQNACADFPRHYGLQRMLVEWSREAGPESVESSARVLLELEPSDAWARRELAVTLVQMKRVDDALREAIEAVRIEPSNTYSFSVLAFVHRHLGQAAEARRHLRRAIELSVDNADAISALLDLASTDVERKEDLAFVERELVRQVVAGDGLLAYVETARPIFEAETLLGVLRAAHAERPDLSHAWSALVAQLGHMLRLDEALTIAMQASERFAHLPRTWLDIAFVHRWRNEPDEEIRAAERAFEMNPLWNPATLALTAALERRGRMDDARAVYERALGHSPHDAQLCLFHANLLWRLRSIADAFAALERALKIAPANDWAWDLLRDWSIQSGQPERDTEFARTLARERPGEARIWLALARALTTPDARDERFRAVERAIELSPRSTDAWDLKAELAALAERFDDAIRACEEGTAVCTNDTYKLRGRRAWIMARRGARAEAIDTMRAVLADNAGYVWGWHQLGMWLIEQGSLADATAAFGELRRLRPHDSWVHRQLAFLNLKQKDRAGAKSAFAAALDAVPTDTGAAHSLFDIQIEDSDLAGANTTLRAMQMHQPGTPTLAAEIVLRLREDRPPAALRVLESLAVSPDPDPWPLDAATDAFLRAGRASAALKVLRRSVRQVSCNPQCGVAIVRLLLARQSWFAAARAFLRFEPGEIQRRAAGPLIQGLAQAKRRWLVAWVLSRRRESLHRDDHTWGQVGFALSELKRMRQVATWLSDWRQRTNVEPWMLFNYCLALRHLGRYAAATEVAAYVVHTWGHRDGAADLRMFLAVEQALAGAIADARENLRHAGARRDVLYDQQMVALAEAMVEFQQAPRPERPSTFGSVSARLGERFGSWHVLYAVRDVRRTFRRAGTLFAREGAGARASLWFAWKLHWQWSLLCLTPLVLVVAAVLPASLGLLALLVSAWFAAGRSRAQRLGSES